MAFGVLPAARGVAAVAALAQSALNAYRSTNTSQTMSQMMSRPRFYAPRRTYNKRRYSRRMYKPNPSRPLFLSLHRTSTPGSFFIGAGADKATGFIITRLQDVYTADIVPMFDVYRIRKVVFEVTNLADPANSAVNSNFIPDVYLGCEPTGQDAAATNPYDICKYANYRFKSLPSGDKFIYTFYPKPLNSIGATSGVATQASYGMANPWINLTSSGIAIPHYNLHYGVKFPIATGATAVNFRYNYTIYFDVMNTK